MTDLSCRVASIVIAIDRAGGNMHPFTDPNNLAIQRHDDVRVSTAVRDRKDEVPGLRALLSGLLGLVLVVLALIPLGWQAQATAGSLLIAGAIALSVRARSQTIILALIVVSAFATCRYVWWRLVQTWEGVTSAGHLREWDTLVVVALVGAELWAIRSLTLGYAAAWRRMREPAVLSRDSHDGGVGAVDGAGHALHALPRLIFLIAPLMYLLFRTRTFYGGPLAVAAYALPHLVIAHLTNARIHGCRTAFWNEISDAVLAPFALLSASGGSIGVRLGVLRTASRNAGHELSYHGVRLFLPFVVLLAISVAGLAAASQRLIADPAGRGDVVVNGMWAAYNVVILSIGAAVARQRVRRTTGVSGDPNGQVNRRHGHTAAATASIVLLAVLAPSLIDADDVADATSKSGASAEVSDAPASGASQLPLTLVNGGRRRGAHVPIVFSSAPEPDELKAAAIVASWFGVVSDRQDVRFPVSIGELPAGNAVLIARRGSALARRVALSAGARGGAEVVANPRGGGALLVIVGTGSGEILATARTLVIEAVARTPRTTLTGGDRAADPGGYDAPRWLSTAHAVPIAGAGNVRLTIHGAEAIDVPVRLPPDLFFPARQAVPLRLRFSYSGPTADRSAALHIRLNSHHVDSIQLDPASPATQREETVWLPTSQLRPYLNTLTFAADLGAANAPSEAPRVIAIDRQSSIDLRGLPHSTVLPRLDLLVDAGYPFTASPDLSRTAFVLSNVPTPGEYETVLNVSRVFASQTGLPVTGISIVGAGEVDTVRDKDLLVLGKPASQPLLSQWADAMPLAFTRDGLRINRDAGSSPWVFPHWPFQRKDRDRLARLVGAGYTFDAVIEQFASPFRSDRSVVALVSGDEDGKTAATAMTAARAGDVNGGLAVARNGRFESFRLAVTPFRSGDADLLDRARVTLIEDYWVMPFVVLLIALAMGSLLTPSIAYVMIDRVGQRSNVKGQK